MDLNEEKVKALLTAVRSGTDLETSCHFAGLSVNEVYKWLERGLRESQNQTAGNAPNEQESSYYEFWQTLAQGRASAIVRNVSSIQKAAQDGQWQAAAWWLERTAPEQYAKRKQTAQLNPEVKPLAPIKGQD